MTLATVSCTMQSRIISTTENIMFLTYETNLSGRYIDTSTSKWLRRLYSNPVLCLVNLVPRKYGMRFMAMNLVRLAEFATAIWLVVSFITEATNLAMGEPMMIQGPDGNMIEWNMENAKKLFPQYVD